MNNPDTLGYIASSIIMIVYVTYLIQVVRGQSTPNPATWLIWITVLTLNTVTFFLTVKNIPICLISLMGSLNSLTIFLYSLRKKKLTGLGHLEIFILILTAIIGLVWYLTSNSGLANALIQIILIISFWPTLNGLIKGTAKEKSVPWLLAVLAYTFTLSAVLINPNSDYNYVELAFPMVNGILGNGSIAVLAILKNKT